LEQIVGAFDLIASVIDPREISPHDSAAWRRSDVCVSDRVIVISTIIAFVMFFTLS
jgi:hypothetical protein